MSKKNEKHGEYAILILNRIYELFDQNNDDYIDDINEGDNLTEFGHALLNTVPMSIINDLTNKDHDMIGINNMASRLIVQFLTKEIEQDKSL